MAIQMGAVLPTAVQDRVREAQQKADTPCLASIVDDAVNRADAPEVALLLDLGLSHELRDVVGDTPLINAAWVGSVEVVALLLARGAEVNATGANGHTALARLNSIPASQFTIDHAAVKQLLVQAGGR